MSKADFRKEEFTNHLGQVLKPGDPVVFVGTCRGFTSVRRGVFEGVYYGSNYWAKDKTPKVTGLKVSFASKRAVWNNGEGYKHSPGFKNELSYEPCTSYSALRLKRAYKIDTTLAEAHSA